jgi:hypothetical protein
MPSPTKPDRVILLSPDAFHKWSDEHRAQVWNMIERLGKGEVSHKEVREVLREEKKALIAISKQVLGFKPGPDPQPGLTHPESHSSKTPKGKRAGAQRSRAIGSQAPG